MFGFETKTAWRGEPLVCVNRFLLRFAIFKFCELQFATWSAETSYSVIQSTASFH